MKRSFKSLIVPWNEEDHPSITWFRHLEILSFFAFENVAAWLLLRVEMVWEI